MTPLVEMSEELQKDAECVFDTWPVDPRFPEKRLRYTALSSKCLAVAVVWPETGDFRVYLDGVPGVKHNIEVFEVAAYGQQQSEELARVLFPELHNLTYWRY